MQAPGLAAVAQILQAIGTVSIIAPAEQQSSSGHGLVTRDPIYRQDLTLPNGMRAIGLTATPASVVRVAMRMIMQPRPDLVVSGINRGYNLAYSGYVSGTLAAARDAAMFGVPAVAASTPERATPGDYIAAAEEVLGVARRVKQYGLAPGTFLNVNIPLPPPGGYKGYRIVSQALMAGGDESFAEMKDPSGRTDVLECVQGRRRGAGGHRHVGRRHRASSRSRRCGWARPSRLRSSRCAKCSSRATASGQRVDARASGVPGAGAVAPRRPCRPCTSSARASR